MPESFLYFKKIGFDYIVSIHLFVVEEDSDREHSIVYMVSHSRLSWYSFESLRAPFLSSLY